MVFFILQNNIKQKFISDTSNCIYCHNHIFKFTEMTDYTAYSQFLNVSYRKILEACLEDQAIDTLKILQNKDYLLLRINELFSQIYVTERQNKIQEQAKTIDSLRQKQTANVLLGKAQKCLQCESLKQQIKLIEHEKKEILKRLSDQTGQNQRQTKKIERMLLKQNEDMNKQLKRLREQLIQQKEHFQQERQMISNQNNRIESKLKNESQKYDQNIRMLRNVIAKHQNQKENLQRTVFQFMESKGREEKQGRQNLTKLNNAILIKQKQMAELSLLKSENNILEDKIIRLKEENQYLKQKQIDYEKNKKKLQIHTDELQKQSHKTAYNHNSGKNHQSQEGQWEVDMLTKLNQTQKKLVETQKQNNCLRMELVAKQKQYSEVHMHQQKQILTLSEELKKCQLKHERQIKTIKEEYKKLLLKNNQETIQTKEQEKEETVKKYETIINQKQRIIAKKEEEFTVMTRTLAQTHRNLQDMCQSYEQQKAIIIRQLQEQKQKYKNIKKHYSLEKTSDQSLQKQYKEKVSEVQAQKQEMHRLVLLKQKQIKEYKKEMLKVSEKSINAELRYQQYKNKYQRSVQTVDDYIKQVHQLKDSLKQKDKELKQLTIKNNSISEQKDEFQKKQMSAFKNEKRLQQKIKRVEIDLNHKRQILLQIHKDNKDDVIDVFDKVQQTTSQTRKQLEQYYMNLLQSNEEKKSNQQLHQLQRLKNEQLRAMKSKTEESEKHLSKYKQKYTEELNQNQNYQNKINDLSRQIDQLKEQNNRAFELVRQQKNKYINIVKTYQNKMQQYYNNFHQFKREFYLNIREELQKIKHQMKGIAQYMTSQTSGLNQQLVEISQRVSRESQLMNTHYHLKTQKIRHQYDYGVVSKLEEQKREIQLVLQMKLKEQAMEFFTIMAEKEHQITSLEDKQAKQSKRINQAETKYDDISKIARQATKKQEQLKEIINKMNQKVSEAQRIASNANGELDYYKSENIQLKRDINSLETSFKQKIQKCREKYSSQNERLFAKYQKQFSKFIVSNKKSLQFSMLSNSCSNLHVPTKGVSNDDRLQTIQREIEQQKKKLNLLQKGGQSKVKFEKTSKIIGYGSKLEKQRRS